MSAASRATTVLRAAQQVRFIATWLRTCEWPIPLEEVERVVGVLAEAARACSFQERADERARQEEAEQRWVENLETKGSRDPNLSRELAMFFSFASVLAPMIRAGQVDAIHLRRLGLLAARVLNATAETYRAIVREEGAS